MKARLHQYTDGSQTLVIDKNVTKPLPNAPYKEWDEQFKNIYLFDLDVIIARQKFCEHEWSEEARVHHMKALYIRDYETSVPTLWQG